MSQSVRESMARVNAHPPIRVEFRNVSVVVQSKARLCATEHFQILKNVSGVCEPGKLIGSTFLCLQLFGRQS
jgi:hypothetical protein